MTLMSMWITLWKLGISLAYLIGFHKNMDKKLWKSRETDFSTPKIVLNWSILMGKNMLCNYLPTMVK